MKSHDNRGTIVVIHHERQPRETEECFLISWMGKRWREWGFDVEHLYGISTRVEADLAIIHVDLSVVPDSYAEFAASYPQCVNLGLRDIRKSRISRNLVAAGEDYDGPVIVKTDLNHGGTPEVLLGLSPPRTRSLTSKLKRRFGIKDPLNISSPADYLVYENASQVPLSVFAEPSLVVERFLPESKKGTYYHRRYLFCGDVERNEIWSGGDPINSSDHSQGLGHEVSVPEQLRELRKQYAADYGKLDYVLHDGRVEVFDVNRTPTGSPLEADQKDAEWARLVADLLSEGIHTWLA
ncbi:MAG: hypothetical protein ACI8QC_000555 [Planctomycetota bacterium]|jgi:hypothetical protein